MKGTKMKKWIVLLMGILIIMTGCTSRNNIVSVEEEFSSSYSVEKDEGEDTLLKIKEPEDPLLEEASEESEPAAAMTESEAKNLALAAAMRVAEKMGEEVDQTSVQVLDQDEDVYYVSVDHAGNSEIYRVDKNSREVSDLDGNPVSGNDDIPEYEDSQQDDSMAIIEDEGY